MEHNRSMIMSKKKWNGNHLRPINREPFRARASQEESLENGRENEKKKKETMQKREL